MGDLSWRYKCKYAISVCLRVEVLDMDELSSCSSKRRKIPGSNPQQTLIFSVLIC